MRQGLVRSLLAIGMAVVISFGAGLLLTSARAEVRIDITRGHLEPLPIAITNFFGKGTQNQEVGNDIATVIAGNLNVRDCLSP